jgi:aminopeptidase
MDIAHYTKQFARVAMTGLNLQPGQNLVIKVEPENLDTAVAVTEEAYARGARYVELWPESTRMTRARIDHSSKEYLDFAPAYWRERIDELIRDRWALLSIKSPVDLSVMDGVDTERNGIVSRGVRSAQDALRRALSSDETQWTVMAVPSVKWAAAVLGRPATEETLLAFWRAMEPILRLNHDDPAEYWKRHGQTLIERSHKLMDLKIRSLHFTAPGTDVTVPLHEKALWLGGGASTQSGIPFLPNVPTEEVFTAPFAPLVSGRVAVTRPVRVYGSRVDGAWFDFRDGSVVDYGAAEGRDSLRAFLEMDEGSKRMGEIALVDNSSPIAQSGLVFQNILLDESATCHFALGSAYPTCLDGGVSMSDQELTDHGANRSQQHLDFMIGSDDMDIDAVLADGSTRRIMEHGRLQV